MTQANKTNTLTVKGGRAIRNMPAFTVSATEAWVSFTTVLTQRLPSYTGVRCQGLHIPHWGYFKEAPQGYLHLHVLKAFFKQQRPNSTSQGGLKESCPAEGAVLCPRTPEPSGQPVLCQHPATQVLLGSLRTRRNKLCPAWGPL